MSIEESPRQAEAQAYLHDHRVLELFDNLTSMLIFSRPEKPKNFLIDVLENLQVRIADFYSCWTDGHKEGRTAGRTNR